MKWNWYVEVLKKYAAFDGRARREEFWIFALVNLVVMIVLSLVSSFISMIYSFAVLLPNLAVGARRLHDTSRSGWWQLLWFIPIIGWIVVIVFLVQDSEPGENEYGPNPKTGV